MGQLGQDRWPARKSGDKKFRVTAQKPGNAMMIKRQVPLDFFKITKKADLKILHAINASTVKLSA